MATRYHFVTAFRLRAPDGRVWETLDRPERWPDWWTWLRESVVLEDGDESGVGKVVRNTVATPIGYRLTYEGRTTRSVRDQLIEFEASGDLIGEGRFILGPGVDDEREIVLNWVVATPKWWMNLTAPVARPVFSWNHDRLMTDFAKGLASAAGGQLLTFDNKSLKPDDDGFFVLPRHDR